MTRGAGVVVVLLAAVGGARGAQHDGHLHAAGALSHHALSPAHSMQRTGSASRQVRGSSLNHLQRWGEWGGGRGEGYRQGKG